MDSHQSRLGRQRDRKFGAPLSERWLLRRDNKPCLSSIPELPEDEDEMSSNGSSDEYMSETISPVTSTSSSFGSSWTATLPVRQCGGGLVRRTFVGEASSPSRPSLKRRLSASSAQSNDKAAPPGYPGIEERPCACVNGCCPQSRSSKAPKLSHSDDTAALPLGSPGPDLNRGVPYSAGIPRSPTIARPLEPAEFPLNDIDGLRDIPRCRSGTVYACTYHSRERHNSGVLPWIEELPFDCENGCCPHFTR